MSYLDDRDIPVKKLQMRASSTGPRLTEASTSKPFMKGPIPMDWLSSAAHLPGKALNVALAVHWLAGMNGNKPTKLIGKSLKLLNVSDDACSDGLRLLEAAGLIAVTRLPGQRPVVAVRQLDPPQ